MISTKINAEITEYHEKFFLGLSLRQLASFAAAGVLAVATSAAGVYWLHLDMQVISYIVMVEVLPFLGFGFIRRSGYPFEELVKIYWNWHSRNPHVPVRPYKECYNADPKKRKSKTGAECQFAFQISKKDAQKRAKAARKRTAEVKKAIKKDLHAGKKKDHRAEGSDQSK